MSAIARFARQGRIAVAAVKTLLSAPQMLIYPVLAAVLGLGLPAALLGAAIRFGPGGPFNVLAVLGLFVVFPVAFAVLMTAYCYEVDEALAGRSPGFGSGLAVAARRFKLVCLAGLIVGTGGFAVQFARGTRVPLPFARVIGATSAWGLRIAGVFAFPVVATTDATLDEAFDEVREAAQAEWGKSMVAAVGTRAIGVVVAWAGIFAGIALGAAAFLGAFSVSLPPLGPFTLPVAVPVAGILAAVVLQFTVGGIVKTALYRYATDGELPAALALDADDLVTDDPTAGPAMT